MIIKKLSDVPFIELSGYKNVKKQIVIGPDDGSNEIVFRYFRIDPGGNTPRHVHDFPHLVQIEKGKGALVDAEGKEHPLIKGDFIYINDNELHSVKNVGPETFEFVCIVPARGEA